MMKKILSVILYCSFLDASSLENFLFSSTEPIVLQPAEFIATKDEFVPKEGEHKLNAMMREMKESVRSTERDISRGIKNMIPIKDLKIKTKIKPNKLESQFIYPIFTDE
ncbi:MAG: hypothetical protein U9N30_00915 [Campylobacterota bacterium]|nr:hypothetical protein [Campylobacterota bacterium]